MTAVNKIMSLSELYPWISEALAEIMRERFKSGFIAAIMTDTHIYSREEVERMYHEIYDDEVN
jgi:hypothetical protein